MAVEDIDWRHLPYMKTVVCYILKDKEEVLLIRKKRGLGQGKFLGPGGKLETKETFEEACIREVYEEVGIEISKKNLYESGDLYFYDKNLFTIHNKVFIAKDFKGSLCETDEAYPFWQSIWQLPLHNMWRDDLYWLLPVLQGSYVQGCFEMDGDKILSLYTELSHQLLKPFHIRSKLKDPTV